MSWRFRKVLALGFTRFRIGRNAQGRWYISFGIPFTGVTWIKQF